MPRSAKETVQKTSLLKGILNGYPGNSAIFREPLQNSDDAGATYQGFILDERQHPNNTVLDPLLRETQGPALIAWNDGLLSDKDWKALMQIHSSSKVADETQTGKNGLGFRSSYHFTENPHILSRRRLMIFDPHEEFEGDLAGGAEIDVVDEGLDYADQLAGFSSIVERPFEEFNGTIFRFPLRTEKQAERSRIKNTPTTVSEMRELLLDFGKNGLEEAILFLKNIRTIEIKDVTDAGCEIIGKFTVERTTHHSFDRSTDRVFVELQDRTFSRTWHFFRHSVPKHVASSLLSERLSYDIGDFLTVEKLTADVELAIAGGTNLSNAPPAPTGRLFTLLPLPIRTGFPVQLNAVFALTPDRQSLKNLEEVGLPRSRERYDRFFSWKHGSNASFKRFRNIWNAWPSENKDPNSYWSELLPSLVVKAKDQQIFPVYSSENFTSLTNTTTLVTSEDTNAPLSSFANLGVTIVPIPPHIFFCVEAQNNFLSLSVLSTSTLYERLLKSITLTGKIRDEVVKDVVDYLVFSTAEPQYSLLIGLPLFTLVSGSRVTFARTTLWTINLIVPQSKEEADLFSTCENLLEWSYGLERLWVALPNAASDLNVALLNSGMVVKVLSSRFHGHGVPELDIRCESDEVDWLIRFWEWAIHWDKRRTLVNDSLSPLYILPTSNPFHVRQWSHKILTTTGAPAALVSALKTLGISILHPNLTQAVSIDLERAGAAISTSSTSYINFFSSNFKAELVNNLSGNLTQALRSSLAHSVASLTPKDYALTKRLADLPIFSVHSEERDVIGSSLTSLREDIRCVKIDESFPMPATPSPVTYVDMADHTTDTLVRKFIIPPLSLKVLDVISLLTLCVDEWDLQRTDLQPTFIEHILDNLFKFPNTESFRLRLINLPFITVGGLDYPLPPCRVIDPGSKLAQLYAGEPGRLPSGRFAAGKYFSLMQSMNFFQGSLNVDIVKERFCYISSSGDHLKALVLLQLLNSEWTPSYRSLIVEYRDTPWLPIFEPTPHMVCPSDCRDAYKGGNSHPYFYDYVRIVATDASWEIRSPPLRDALGWDDAPSVDLLVRQVVKTIEDAPKDLKARLETIVSHLAHCDLSPEEKAMWRDRLKDRAWIPVLSSRLGQQCASTRYVTVEETTLGDPFYQAEQVTDDTVCSFLREMGCTNRPTLEVLKERQAEILLCSPPDIKSSLRILEEIADNYSEPASTLLRDFPLLSKEGQTRELQDVYFCDVDIPFFSLASELQRMLPVHPDVSSGLAARLGIQPLSSLHLGEYDDDEDDEQMGQDLVSRIREFLRENDIRFAVNEWLANADDAEAKAFSMLLYVRGSHNVPKDHGAKISTAMNDLYTNNNILVLHNDSRFTPDDFRGIRRVGTGGKVEQEGTHGRHGLGALSLYYFTDVPTIISGGHILLLDPSGNYLPPRRGGKRTSLFRTLESFARQYPSHFDALTGIFGFDHLLPDYDGTLFVLPLSSMIYQEGLSVDAIHDLLERNYRDLADDVFFFTRSLTSVSAIERRGLDFKALWTSRVIERSTTNPLGVSFSRHDLVLAPTRSPCEHERWLIATSSQEVIPDSHQETARSLKLLPGVKIPVQIALQIGSRLSSRGPRKRQAPTSHIFSTVKIPRRTELPFHINSVFAITANRQNLVFHPPQPNGEREPKSAFNAWIFLDLVPSLCAAVVEHVTLSTSQTSEIQSWIQSTCKTKDDLSSFVESAFWKRLPHSSARIFCSVDGSVVAFEDAVFSYKEPSSVSSLLETLPFRNFSLKYPRSTVSTLEGVKTLTPNHVKECLLDPAMMVRLSPLLTLGTVTPDHLAAAAQFVIEGEVTIAGFPILTSTGELRAIPSQAQRRMYISKTAAVVDVFPHSVFLHPVYELSTMDEMARNSNVNVRYIGTEDLQQLVGVELEYLDNMGISYQDWLKSFWSVFLHLPGPPSLDFLLQTSSLKIVSTSQGCKSLSDCSPDLVIGHLARSNSTFTPSLDWLRQTMSQLGIPVIEPSQHPLITKHVNSTFPALEINILRCLRNKRIARFDGQLDAQLHDDFARWLRGNLRPPPKYSAKNRKRKGQRVAGDLDSFKDILKNIPIWPAYRGGADSLVSCGDIHLLPPTISLEELKPYLSSQKAVATYSPSLDNFMSYSFASEFGSETSHILRADDFMSLVIFPTASITAHEELESYKTLLQSLVNWQRENFVFVFSQLRLPDENGQMRPVSELFGHTVPLFVNSLKYTHQSSFLHSSYRNFVTYHHKIGIRTGVTLANFAHCASVVQRFIQSQSDWDDPDQLQKATEVSAALFEAYNTAIPRLLMTNSSGWEALDNTVFIRRKYERRQGASYDVNSFSNTLDKFLPLSQFVLPTFEPIAWTQRALFHTHPSQDVLALHKSLGVPTVEVVIMHLRALSTGSLTSPGNSALLGDLKATYKWLNSRSESEGIEVEDIREHLLELVEVPLFLNVDNPDEDLWDGNWLPANKIILHRYSVGEIKAASPFLRQYDNLLRMAGCHIIYTSKIQTKTSSSPPLNETTSSKLKVLNEMRLKGELTDVILLARDAEDDQDGLRAHKVVLAAAIPHFRNKYQFEAGIGDQGIPDRYDSYFVLRAILDFVYTGELKYKKAKTPDDEATLLSNLLELLEKTEEWEMEDLKGLTQWRVIPIIEKLPHAFNIMRESADRAHAADLKKYLEEFRMNNGHLINQLLSMPDDGENDEMGR